MWAIEEQTTVQLCEENCDKSSDIEIYQFLVCTLPKFLQSYIL